MTDLELLILMACREADEKFEKDGAAGTKEWIREYFLPSLEHHKLEIRLKPGHVIAKEGSPGSGRYA